MKGTWQTCLLFLFISCSKATQEFPEGSLLEKIVVRNLNNSNFKYFTSNYVYENDRLVYIISDIDGTISRRDTFEYDPSGRLMRSGSQSSVINSYQYDSQNRIIRITNETGSGGYYATYNYSVSNQVIKYSLFEKSTGNLINYQLFDYNVNGEVISREVFEYINGSFQSTGKFSQVYDDKLNPFYRSELSIPIHFGGVYYTGIQSKHNYLYEKVYATGQVASSKFLYNYQRNGLPSLLTYSSGSKDSVYYYYK